MRKRSISLLAAAAFAATPFVASAKVGYYKTSLSVRAAEAEATIRSYGAPLFKAAVPAEGLGLFELDNRVRHERKSS
jgi:hypothetical protein